MSRFFSRVTTTSESKETVLIKKRLQFHNWKVIFLFSTCVSGSVSPVRRNTVSFGEDSRKTVAGVSLLTLQVY